MSDVIKNMQSHQLSGYYQTNESCSKAGLLPVLTPLALQWKIWMDRWVETRDSQCQ